MLSDRGAFNDAPNDDDAPQVHAEFAAVQFDERLLPIYEEHQRHKMALEQKQQDDNTKIALQLIAETSTIRRNL